MLLHVIYAVPVNMPSQVAAYALFVTKGSTVQSRTVLRALIALKMNMLLMQEAQRVWHVKMVNFPLKAQLRVLANVVLALCIARPS
jgi:hypothetical protein